MNKGLIYSSSNKKYKDQYFYCCIIDPCAEKITTKKYRITNDYIKARECADVLQMIDIENVIKTMALIFEVLTINNTENNLIPGYKALDYYKEFITEEKRGNKTLISVCMYGFLKGYKI